MSSTCNFVSTNLKVPWTEMYFLTDGGLKNHLIRFVYDLLRNSISQFLLLNLKSKGASGKAGSDCCN